MKPEYRRVEERDTAALSALWTEVFGDESSVPESFLARLPELGGGLTAQLGGQLVGMVFLVTDFTLCTPAPQRIAYLYALAVHPAFRSRGIARELCLRAREIAQELDAVLLLEPAEPSLFAYYEHTLGLVPAGRMREERVLPKRGVPVQPISAEEYRNRRNVLLPIVCVQLGRAAMDFQGKLCALCGGGFFAVGDGIAAVSDGRITELLGAGEEAAASLADFLGTELRLRISDEAGEAYLSAPAGAFPPECHWNLTLD